MKKTAFLLPFFLLLSVTAFAAQISFLDNYDEAVQTAEKQNKKLLITFKSPT